jgi:gamma-glutamylcyclotransferase (GGCT)/AIG2-like uncharacterized protein YtfP
MNNHLIFVYGSLRPKHYNFKALNRSGEIFILKDDIKLKGYKLYSLGTYPGIKLDSDSSIIGTLITVNDSIYNRIKNMELGANYSIKLINVSPYKNVTIFIYNGFVNEKNIVKNGDWNSTLKIDPELKEVEIISDFIAPQTLNSDSSSIFNYYTTMNKDTKLDIPTQKHKIATKPYFNSFIYENDLQTPKH